jgi:hypothetical protein
VAGKAEVYAGIAIRFCRGDEVEFADGNFTALFIEDKESRRGEKVVMDLLGWATVIEHDGDGFGGLLNEGFDFRRGGRRRGVGF